MPLTQTQRSLSYSERSSLVEGLLATDQPIGREYLFLMEAASPLSFYGLSPGNYPDTPPLIDVHEVPVEPFGVSTLDTSQLFLLKRQSSLLRPLP